MPDQKMMDSPDRSTRSIPMQRMAAENLDRLEEEAEVHRLIKPEGEKNSGETETGCWSKFFSRNNTLIDVENEKKLSDRIWVWDGWKRKRFVLKISCIILNS